MEMRSLKDLKIYLLDINPKMCEAWEKNFGGASNVEIVCEEFTAFMEEHKEVDCVVSPANSYGFMDGGFDFALSCYFGDKLEETVQQYIKENLYYEQPVGTSIYRRIDYKWNKTYTYSNNASAECNYRL